MNILLIAVGTRGDVQPFIVLGTALMAAGHQVTLAAPKTFTSDVDAAGIAAAPLPTDYQALLQEPEMQAALNSVSGKIRAYRWANEIMNDQLSAMWKIGQELRPDLILNHFKGSLAPYLARELGARSVPIALQPGFAPTSAYPQFLLGARSKNPQWNRTTHAVIGKVMQMGTNVMFKRWSKASGVDLGAKMDTLGGYDPMGIAPRIHAFSPSLVPRPADWPATEHQTGYFFAPPETHDPDPKLATFLEAGEPPIYAGFGSMPGTDHDRTTRALLGALKATGQRAVLATGWGGISGIESGGTIHVIDSVPHAWLFPRVSAVIHHGGSGTTHEGLRWGRPSIVCPLFADQPFFGARLAELGVGSEPIRQKHLTAERLTDAIRTALQPDVRARAEALGEDIRKEDGIGNALALIDRIASRQNRA